MAYIKVGWKNKSGTGERECLCGSWMEHWNKYNYSNSSWPVGCSVRGCLNIPMLGAHVINPKVIGEQIIPMCYSCNNKSQSFVLRRDVEFASANTAKTCRR